MREVVVNWDKGTGEFRIYEGTGKVLIETKSLGEGFESLNAYLRSIGEKGILEDPDCRFHFDSATFQEIIKSNLALLNRVSNIPSEFKQSANKFGAGSTGEPSLSGKKAKSGFQKGKMSGWGSSDFKKSYGKFMRK